MAMRMMIVALIVLIGLGGAGSARADFDAGYRAYQSGDYETALREWKPLAEQGDAVAQNNFGFMYSEGLGVPQDYMESWKWYRKAAEQGMRPPSTILVSCMPKAKAFFRMTRKP